MKIAFQWLKSIITKLWRTIVSTFCRNHIYRKDVDSDGVDEFVLDPNGLHEENQNKEEYNNDRESN